MLPGTVPSASKSVVCLLNCVAGASRGLTARKSASRKTGPSQALVSDTINGVAFMNVEKKMLIGKWSQFRKTSRDSASSLKSSSQPVTRSWSRLSSASPRIILPVT